MTDTSRPTVEALKVRLSTYERDRGCDFALMHEAAEVLGALLTERDAAVSDLDIASRYVEQHSDHVFKLSTQIAEALAYIERGPQSVYSNGLRAILRGVQEATEPNEGAF